MPQRLQWDPRHSVGSEVLDDQHRYILAQCNALADHCLDEGGDGDGERFRRIFDDLLAQAREHFATEEALLAERAYPDLEGHRHECGEFEDLVAEIDNGEYFDRIELQRFLALWWLGHLIGSAERQRGYLGNPTAEAARKAAGVAQEPLLPLRSFLRNDSGPPAGHQR